MTRAFANFTPGTTTTKKKLRVKSKLSSSSSSAMKPKHRNGQDDETLFKNNTQQQMVGYGGDYTITFEPGPIGMKLEPISESQGKEIGCRVLQFINLPSGQQGQAEQSGKISPGDVLIQVNHTNVISWTYPDVIRYLKMLPPTQSKQLKFKSVHSIADDFWQHQQPSNRRMKDDGNRGPVYTEKVLTNHILNNLPASEQSRQETMVFSPSKVKALSQQRYSVMHNNSVNDVSRDSDETSTTTTTTAAAALLHHRKPTPFSSKLASQMTNKLAQVLMVEHPTASKELNQAVQLKMQLLTELSHAKITIDAKVQEKKRLETIIRNLSSELDLTRSENTSLQSQVTSWKEAKTNLEQLFEDALTKQDCAMEEQKRTFQMEKDVLVNQAQILADQVATLQQDQVKADQSMKHIQAELQKKNDYALEMEAKVRNLEQVVAHQQATIEVAHTELETSRRVHQEDTTIKDEFVTFATLHAGHLEDIVSKHEATTEHAMAEASSKATLDKDVTSKQDVIASIKCHTARLEGIMAHQQAIIDTNNAELETLGGQFDAEMRIKDALVQTTQGRVYQLENTVTELQGSLVDARQKLTDSQVRFAEEVASMESMKSSLQDQANELESELQRVKSANLVLTGSKDDLKAALEKTVSRFESTSNELRLLETKSKEETLKRSQVENELRIVHERCEAHESAITQLRSDKNVAESRLEEETIKRSHFEDQLQVLQRLCETHESTISQLTSDKGMVEDRLDEVTVKLSQAEDQLQTVQQLCATREAAMSQQRSDRGIAESRLEEETIKRSQLEVQLRVVEGICQTHESTISKLQSEKDEAQVRLEEQTIRLSHAEDQLRFVQEACERHESKMSQLQSEKAIAASRLEQETNQRAHAEDQVQLLQELCERHESSISQLHADKEIADKRLEEVMIKLSHAEDQLEIVQELCEAHASSVSQLQSDKDTAESRLEQEAIRLSHAEYQLKIVQELCETHASSISQLQSDKDTAESRLEQETIKRSQADSQLMYVQGVCERHASKILQLQSEKDDAQCRLEEETIKRSHAEDQLRLVQEVCERHESKISQLQSDKDIAENRLEGVQAQLSKLYDEAAKQKRNRRKVLEDFKVLVEEQEKAVYASAEISTELKQNHAELLTDLATFQIILDSACDQSIVDAPASSCSGALPSYQRKPRPSLSITSDPSSGPTEGVLSEFDSEMKKITSAAATLGIMKHDATLRDLNADIVDSEAKVRDSPQQLSMQPVSTRVEQLERFLHDVLLENEVLGAEASGLRSQLDETKRCYDTELKELRTEITILQTGEQRHMQELDDIRQKQLEADAKANIRAKVIATLQSQLDNEVGNYKAKQSEFVDDVERHVHCLEEEVAKAVEANEWLHSSLSEANSKLATADQLVVCLRAKSLVCGKQLEAMSMSIREGTSEKKDSSISLHETQSAHLKIESLPTTMDESGVAHNELSTNEHDNSRGESTDQDKSIMSLTKEGETSQLQGINEPSSRKVSETNQLLMPVVEELTTDDLQRCIDTLQVQVAQVLFDRERALSELKNCNAMLEEQSKRTGNLDAELRAVLKDRARLCQEHNCRISSLEQSEQSLRDQLQKHIEEVKILNDSLSAAQQKASELQSSLELVRSEKAEIADSLQSQVAEVERLNTTVTSSINLMNKLKETLFLMKNQEIERDERLRDKEKEIERLMSINGNAEQKIAALETELSSRTSEFDADQRRLEAENTDLKESLHALEVERETRDTTIQNFKTEIDRLREALRYSEEEANHLADEIIRYRESREQAENDKSVLQSEVDWLHREVQSQDEAAKFLQKRVIELQGDVYPPSVSEGYDEQLKQLTADASWLPSSTDVASGTSSPRTVETISEVALRKSAAGLLIENVLLNRERSELGRGFRQWSTHTKAMGAVSHHLQVAEVMNRQLQTTWSKVAALKMHLKAQQGGGR